MNDRTLFTAPSTSTKLVSPVKFYFLSFWILSVFSSTSLSAQTDLLGGIGNLLGPEFKACVLRAPEINLSKYEKIAIFDFDNDNSKSRSASLGKQLAGALQEALTAEYFGAVKDKIYMEKVPTNIFTLVERNEIDRIIKELGFTVSGMVNEDDNIAKVGKLAGANVIITGRAGYNTETKVSYTDDGDKKVERIVTISASMKVLDVETGELISAFNEIVEAKSSTGIFSSTPDSYTELLNEAVVQMGSKICKHINPYYELYSFEMFDQKKNNKDLGKEGHGYIKRGLTREAFCCYNKIFQEDTYNWRAVFNLGTIHEAVCDYEKAAKFYNLAYQIKDSKTRIKNAAERGDKFSDNLRTLAELGITINPVSLDDNTCNGDASNLAFIAVGRKEYAKVFLNPNNKSETITKLPDGMQVIWVAEEGNFIKVKLDFPHEGKEGYILKDKIEIR